MIEVGQRWLGQGIENGKFVDYSVIEIIPLILNLDYPTAHCLKKLNDNSEWTEGEKTPVALCWDTPKGIWVLLPNQNKVSKLRRIEIDDNFSSLHWMFFIWVIYFFNLSVRLF